MGREVKFGRRDETLVISRRLHIRRVEAEEVFVRSFAEAFVHLERLGAAADGPPFVIYHGLPEGDEPYPVEMCAPVARTIDPPEGWRLQWLPAGAFVTALHVGSYDTLDETYDEIRAWMRAHDLVSAGPPREVYLSDAATPPEETRTIVEFPVAAVPVSTTAN